MSIRNLCYALLSVAALHIAAPSTAYAQLDTFRITDNSGDSGDQGVGLMVLFDTVSVSQGWSFGACHDASEIDLVTAVSGATTLTVKNGNPPDFNQINLYDGGVTVGVVICFIGCASLPVGTDLQILDLSYDLIGVPVLADIVSDVCFCDSLGTPPVATVLVVGGQSVIPVQDCGSITIPLPPEFCLELECTADFDVATLTWTACSPFEYYLLNRNGELLEVLPPDTTEYIDDTLDTDVTYYYSLIGVVYPDPTGPALIIEELCDAALLTLQITSLSPTRGFFYGGDVITIEGAGFLTGTDLTVSVGGLAATDVVVVDDSHVTARTPAFPELGAVTVTVTHSIASVSLLDAFTYGFVRGDANCDTAVDIGDAQYVLNYLFIGGAMPCCFDAADANDDGGINAADPIYTLNHLFSSGPPLPLPFPAILPRTLDPADAGLDPTDDPLICI
ncbi:MAG: IPT/TIG domain-containing protein [Planctomycetota bacterium]